MGTKTYKVVPEPSQQFLNKKELIDYRSHREQRIEWYENLGKHPRKANGYSHSTLTSRLTNLDKFYRHVWGERGYTAQFTHDDADNYVQELIYDDLSDQYRANCQKSIQMYFKYRAYSGGTKLVDESLVWEPDVTFSQHTPTTVGRDYFTARELDELRGAALSYGSPPHYNTLTPDQRDEWKIHLAQRYEIPKARVGPTEFEKADGFKIASLVCTCLDTGLRPIEVGRATTEWVDEDNEVLRIPKDTSTKNDENWEVALTSATTRLLSEWIDERELYEKYDETDALWLTKYSNPYDSQNLSRLIRRLCEDTSIDESRDPTWYWIRRGVASRLANNANIHTAQMQLRHKSPETTMKYVQTDIGKQRKVLENSL